MRNQIKLLSLACGMVLAGFLSGCGSSTSSTQNQVTGLKKRVFVTNVQAGTMTMIDGLKDRFAPKAFSLGSPGKMVVGGGFTVVQETATNAITIFDNTKEQIAFTPATSAVPFDVAISPDGKTAWAAMRNPGFVEAFDTSNGNILATISAPNAVRLVMSPQGGKLLVFADNPQGLPLPDTDAFYVINTAGGNNSTVAAPVRESAGDQPFSAVFNGSDNQAFILNCGAECGSTTGASVVFADFSGAAPVLGTPIPVAGATVGLLSGQSFFVAGTPPTLPAGLTCPATLGSCGTLQAISTASFTAGAPFAITDGLHQVMAITSNSRLYVGAKDCTTAVTGSNVVRGCLTIFDTGTQTLTFPSESALRQDFDVTSLQPITGRNVIYVVQGGELDFFDIATNAIATGITPIDIIGNAIYVVQIDP
ncbi:MAG TPA: hypothetical protein VFL42_03420 [Terriglobales bacterium]|nr:hypothetical protein [Terriglobales bacterium]